MTDRTRRCAVNERGHRIAHRCESRGAEIERHDIRQLARFERPRLLIQPQRPGASERCHAQHAGRLGPGGVAARVLGEQRRQARFREQVEGVVRRGTVGAQGQVDARVGETLYRADAARQLEIGVRAVDDVDPVQRNEIQFTVGQLRHVHRLQRWRQQAQIVQEIDPGLPDAASRLGHLGRVFMQMRLYRPVEFLRVHPGFLQRPAGDGVGGVWPEHHVDQGVALEVVVQRHAPVQRFVGVVAPGVGEIQNREGHLGAHARARCAARHLVRVVIHVGEGGDAHGQHLGEGEIGAVAHEIP